MLSLALDHPEWESALLEQVEKNKPHVENPEEVLARLRTSYREWVPNESSEEGNNALWWKENLPEVRKRVENLISYFRPREEDITRQLVIVPSDNLLPSTESGQSFHIAGTTIVISHTKNWENMEHKFLHGIVNPVTERLEGKIPKEKVIALASRELRERQEYGEHAESLLNEELIRTFNESIETGKGISSFEDFKKAVDEKNDEALAGVLNDSKMKERCAEVGISSVEDFRTHLQDYYDAFEKNELREKIYPLYRKFEVARTKEPTLRFEDFLDQNLAQAF